MTAQTPHRLHDAAAKGFQIAPDAYERGRPEYPQEAVQYLVEKLGIGPHSTVIDLGAGTGKFTKLILPTKATVLAVEPVEGMRSKLSSTLPGIQALDGSAEAIPLNDDTVDSVVAAQAFHWFDGNAALKEIYRVLKPQGKLGLIWNARDVSIDWVSKLSEIIDPHRKDTPGFGSGQWRDTFENTNLFTPLQTAQFRYIQAGPPEMIVDRVASISFISALSENERAFVLEKVRSLLKTHPQTSGKTMLELPYRTDVFWCEKCG